ncbi:hypothetical protein [uncultured Nostoc sp.]|uniref:hypothetical protein n=1 Tax=uncultured Nostoc sp. TaxID=340711 RepID=UPI0035C9BC28
MMVNWEFEKRSLHVFSISDLPIKLIIFSMIGLLGVGTLAGRLTSQPANSVIHHKNN